MESELRGAADVGDVEVVGDVPLAELLASWEPHDVRLKLSVTRSFALALERVCADQRLSKSLVLREAVRRGLPALVNDITYLRSQGYRSGAHLSGRLALTGRRGPKGEGSVSARWSERPGDVSPDSPWKKAVR